MQKSLELRGVRGTIAFLGRLPWLWLDNRLKPSRIKILATDCDFDAKYQVDTGGIIPISELTVRVDSWIHGHAYQGSPGSDLSVHFDAIGIDYPNTVFVDLGSGKGKALMLAASRPFKKIIGVEFSAEFHGIALKNIDQFVSTNVNSSEVQCRCDDALQFEYPQGPLLLYLYNPFDQVVMNTVVERLTRSYRADPRSMIVFYMTALYEDLWDHLDFLECVTRSPEFNVYITPEHRGRLDSTGYDLRLISGATNSR